MENLQVPRGPLRRTSDLFHSANPQLTAKIGIVKSNIDVLRTNTLQVYIVGDPSLNPDNSKNWVTVFFLSPFFGATPGDAPSDNNGSYVTNPASYGMWIAPPDIGTQVLCLFAAGDMNYGFWIGCIPDPTKLHMVPAIGSGPKAIFNDAEAKQYGGATTVPVTNINSNNPSIADTPDFLTAAKPVHSYSAHIMFQQGILRDPIRGPISSSSQRETPSRVGWGVSTPGRPIYQGGFTDDTLAKNLTADKANELRVISRRLGHSIVMDDGDIAGKDRLIRIRTAQGHQILMSDDGQTLMLLHSNGQSYVELGKEGTVDVYSTNSINLRTHGDLNLHADRDVNIHAGKNLNLQGENVKINSDESFQQRSGADHNVLTTGTYTHKVGGVYAVSSGDEASLVSATSTFINGAKVNLNSGKPGAKPGDVSPIDKALHTDTVFDNDKGFIAAPVKLQSITSRAPAHAPWAMACQGVDVKVDLTSAGAFPADPSAAVQNTNLAADAQLTNGVSSAVVASAPQIPKVSKNIETNTTKSLVATAASDAKSGPYADATQTGTAIVTTDAGVEAAAGASIPMTANQMQTAGVLKPGSAPLVNSIGAGTNNAALAFSPVLFSSRDVNSFAGNASLQATAMANVMRNSETVLQNTGLIKGTETTTQTAGMIYAGAQNGVPAVVDAAKLLAGGGQVAAAGAVAGAAVGPASDALKNIGKGNFAAGIASGKNTVLSGMQDSLNSLKDKLAASVARAKGAAAGAFISIKQGFKKFKAHEPQDLEAIAKKNAEGVAKAGLDAVTNLASQAASAAVNSAIASNPIAAAAAGIALNAATNNASLASGLNNIPGGGAAVSAVSSGAVPNLSGTQDLKSTMQNVSTTAMNNLSGTQDLKSTMQNVSTTAMNNLSGAAGNAVTAGVTDALKKNPVTALISKGLPAGLAAKLQNIFNSIAPAGSGLKVPTVATATTDRSAIDGTAKAQLEDTRIPPPVWETATDSDAYTAIEDQAKEYDKLLAAVSAVEAKQVEVTKKVADLTDKLRKLPYEARNPDNPDYSDYKELQDQATALFKERTTLAKEYLDATVAANDYYKKTYSAQA